MERHGLVSYLIGFVLAVILTLVYHDCPMLCNEVLNALTRGLKGMTFDVGKQFEVVTVSINPAETTELAARKKASGPP